MQNNMAFTEIALLKWKTNESLVSEECWFDAVQLSRRIWGKSRSYLKSEISYIAELPGDSWESPKVRLHQSQTTSV